MDRQKVCIDSCFIIDMLEGMNKPANALAKLGNLDIYVSEISIFEVCRGIFSGGRGNKKKFEILIDFLETIQILPPISNFAMGSAKISAELIKAGKKIDNADCLIAGMMFSCGITKIITKNVKHFSSIKGIEAIGY